MTSFEKIATELELLPTLAERSKRKMRGPTMFDLDDMLVHTDAWKQQKEMFPCRSGLFMCYEKWGLSLGSSIDWEGLKIAVPKRFQGQKNIALVCYDDQVQVKGKVLTSAKFEAFNLPHNDGWYDIDATYGLPIGEEKDYAPERRHLWRYQDEAYIGLVVRWYGRWDDGYRRVVDCGSRPDSRFGVHGTTTPRTGRKPDLKRLAMDAGIATDKLRNVVQGELLAPIDALVEAAGR